MGLLFEKWIGEYNMLKSFYSLGILIFLFSELSLGEPSDFELELSKYNKKETRESIVESEGVLYRKIEFKGNYYYLELRKPEESDQSQKVFCSKDDLNHEKIARVYGEIKIIQRSSIFIEALRASCHSKPDMALKIGFTLPEKEKDVFKNKRVIIFPGLGVSGDF